MIIAPKNPDETMYNIPFSVGKRKFAFWMNKISSMKKINPKTKINGAEAFMF
jgi:hypothetical protein